MTWKLSAILLGCASLCVLGAQEPALSKAVDFPVESIGDWKVTFYGSGSALAIVTNSSGMTFGSLCSPASCSTFINPQIDCEEGHSYPALVNAPSAAFSINLKCEKINNFYVYDVPLEGGITDAMSVGGVIGFAFPMASGEFKVARYSLTGAARAIARAQQASQPTQSRDRSKGSDSYSL